MEFRVGDGYFYVILVLIGQYILTTEAIRCYRCIVAPYVYSSNAGLCKDFDYSEKFITDCPYSTFCMTINSYAVISGVQINGTERHCAPQKLDTQRVHNGKWKAETLIEEPYTEGCKKDENKLYKTPYVEHCYCRGELCNSGNSVNGRNYVIYYRTMLFSVFSIFMTVKAVNIMFL